MSRPKKSKNKVKKTNKRMKVKKYAKLSIIGEPKIDSDIKKFRDKYLKQEIELVDITQLCEWKLGRSGVCNYFNEPNEEIYHLQCHYRDENIAVINGDNAYAIDEDKYVVFITNKDDLTGADFTIYKLCKN